MTNITLNRTKVQQIVDLADKHGTQKWFMAKDQGAYVGACGGSQEEGTFENVIFYFNGCDPKKDEDWWENASYKFGGDDFGEHFEMDILRKLLKDPNFTKMVLTVGKTQISMKSYARPAPKPQAAPKPVKAKADKPVTNGKSSIGQIAMRGIENGMTNEQIISLVKSVYPDAKTSNASINWYRSKMRKAQA